MEVLTASEKRRRQMDERIKTLYLKARAEGVKPSRARHFTAVKTQRPITTVICVLKRLGLYELNPKNDRKQTTD